jgi:hypothetical protein
MRSESDDREVLGDGGCVNKESAVVKREDPLTPSKLPCPKLIKLGNALPIDSSVCLGDHMSQRFKAFSCFVNTNVDSVTCGWNVLYDSNGKSNDENLAFAFDDMTASIVSSCAIFGVGKQEVALAVTTWMRLQCMTCEKSLHFSQNISVCKGCGLACYCNERCAKIGWIYCHSSVCGMIKNAVTGKVKFGPEKEDAYTIQTDKEIQIF